MVTTGHHVVPDHPGMQYEIRIDGHLSPRLEAWFDGLRLVAEADGTTTIRGPVVDQAALHGLLQKLRDVGLPLISVTPIPSNEQEQRHGHD